MSLDQRTFDVNGSGSKGGMAKHTYKTSDALATVLASGYFNALATVLHTGDRLSIFSTHASDGGGVEVGLTNTSNVMTTNSGGSKIYLFGRFVDVGTAETVQVVSPVAGNISKWTHVLQAAITTADANLKLMLGATDVTGSAIVVAYTSSAAGDLDTASPTALNIVTAGQAIKAVTDGANSGTAAGSFVIEITPNT